MIKKYLFITFLITWILWLPSFLLSNTSLQIPNILLLFGNFATLAPFFAVLIVNKVRNFKDKELI